MMRAINFSSGLWALTALVGFLLSLVIAWHLLSPVNFFYSQWYELIGIDDNIAEYGPLNRNRQGFETTSRAEHERLMTELVAAINHGGEGLSAIEYKDDQGEPIDSLLTDAEITHMHDVATLIHWVNMLGVALAAVLFALLILARWRGLKMPGLSGLLVKLIVLLSIVAGFVLVIGPVKVFYQLHVWLFPDKNQWFFYYEDSLMTTMLKAPVIFGPIAVVLVLLALFVWGLIFYLLARALRAIGDN